jgi:predicted DNA-binding protein (MmcQ/YjbR family)
MITPMRLERLKSFALSLPKTKVVNQWGGLVFKVAEKTFFMISLDGDVIEGVIFKCTPQEFAELVEIDGIGQAPYFAKRMWVCVEDLAALPEQELNKRIRHSYDLVVAKLPRKVQATLT